MAARARDSTTSAGARVVLAAAFVLCALCVEVQCAAPLSCESYVKVGQLEGKAMIGPSSVAYWKVLSIGRNEPPSYRNPQPCVHSLSLQVMAVGRPVLEAVLSVENDTARARWDSGTSWGSGEFSLDSACDWGKGSGVPQLRVRYEANDQGLHGGMNASVVVFDRMVPDFQADSRLLSNSDAVGWTACVDRTAPLPILVNATLWTSVSGTIAGAVFVDADHPVQSQAYSIGLLGNVTTTYTYSGNGVMSRSVACDPTHPCTTNNFQLFSVN
eukprot:TRINITY_DN16116_c0_g1_i1.p1 TRINITY_DN16116_c0_g1~~TRINITY_DN16116_c0_g1_i1.p1  ORF type:complete len:271 (-),score=74.13 TRINITY_DN16116_c0_g1_i1:198-1010(-)